MNNIGIITFYFAYNFGSNLQAYALKFLLENKGDNVKIINFIYEQDFKQYKLFRVNSYLKRPSSLRHLFKIIVFSGSFGKSLFLNKLKKENDINISFSLNLYSNGFSKKDETEILKYKGCFSPDDIIRNMEGSFGLVWDGDEITSCVGTLGE